MIITLSHQVSSNGHLIGQMVAEKLNLHYYDQELLSLIAHKLHTEENLVAQFDGELSTKQRDHFLLDWLLSIKPENYLRALKSALNEITAKDNCLIIGRGANFLLQGRNPIMHIRIMAPLNVRTAILMAENEEYSRQQAEKYIHEHDKKRDRFTEHFFNVKYADNGALYDMTLNLAHYTPEMATDVIAMAATTRFKKDAPISSESNIQSLINLLDRQKNKRKGY